MGVGETRHKGFLGTQKCCKDGSSKNSILDGISRFSGRRTLIWDDFGTQNGAPEATFSCFLRKNGMFQVGSNFHTSFGTKYRKILDARKNAIP